MDHTPIKPKDFTVEDEDGNDRFYVLSNFPATEGREIITLYPTSGLPKIGDYEINKKTMQKLMSYVGVRQQNGDILFLTTDALINNHVPDTETLLKIEWAMMEKNYRFFRDGRSTDFFEAMTQMFLQKLSAILTLSSAQSSPTEKPPSEN